MPSYMFEIGTEQGAERFPFTLDHDRALGPQVTQVIEELRQRSVILKGGRDEILGVFWDGRELDLALRPSDLGISPSRAIELRMRPAGEAAGAPPPDATLPKGILASAALGYAGAVIAWGLTGLLTDTTLSIPTYARLDQVAAGALGALVGGCVLAGAALRTRRSVALAVIAGLLLGGAGAGIGATLGNLMPGADSVRGFLLARVAGWAVAGGMASLLLGLYAGRSDVRAAGESLLAGALAGAACGVIFALPGPSDLWQALAFGTFGAAIGVAACGPPLWRAAALLELAPAGGKFPGILSLREWPVGAGQAAAFGGAQLAAHDGRVALYPPATGMTVDGRTATEPLYLASSAELGVAGEHFRVRRVRGAE